jgi:hypothetical protein
VQVVQARRIGLGQRARQEIGLLLVVAFQHHAVAGAVIVSRKATMSSVGTTLPVAICAPRAWRRRFSVRRVSHCRSGIGFSMTSPVCCGRYRKIGHGGRRTINVGDGPLRRVNDAGITINRP